MRSQRIQEIENYIYEQKTVTLDQICQHFGISKSTIRRDLEQILQNGNIKKIYGGVTVQSKKELISFHERNIAHLAEKERIAKKAAQMVSDGDIIFIDSGTTTLHMIDALADRRKLTVLTNNFEVIYRAIPYENINLISLSGTLNRKTLSFTGPSAAQVLGTYNVSKAFMAATGFSVESGVTNSSPVESDVKRVAVQRSQQAVLLADHFKFDTVSLITYCDLEQIDTLVTDAMPGEKIASFMQAHGSQIVLA